MPKLTDRAIYPRFEFRLSHEEKAWLHEELDRLKEKFREEKGPTVTKNDLLVAALRHGLRHLDKRE